MTTAHDDPNNELTPEIRARLAALPKEAAPPARLEERVMRTLAVEGLMGHDGRNRYAMAAAGLVAAVVIFAAGLAIGVRTARPGGGVGTTGAPIGTAAPSAPADEMSQWALLLYEDAAYRTAPVGAEADRVREYGAWARALADRGVLVAGKKLDDGGAMLTPDGAGLDVTDGLPETREGVLAGYFVIRARNRDEAIAVARDCPHLRYRGRISLRRIDPT